jgi:DNA end-binding protein Ku
MASIWTGAIAFGLVNIPVKVETAVRSHDIGFKLLYEEKKGKVCPVKYKRVCEHNGKEVPWNSIVKGYEYEKEKFVVLTDEDFDRAALATSKTFDIQTFTSQAEVDPRYFEKPYYLIPQKGGERAYALLREAMKSTDALAVGTITLRKKQYLAAIKVVGDALVLELMRFADEVVEPEEYRFPSSESFRPQELKMAEQLIGSLREEFDPTQFRDEYRENLDRIIQGKLKGKKVKLSESAEPEMTGVIDLMDRLKESLEAGGKKPAKATKAAKGSSGSRKRKSA